MEKRFTEVIKICDNRFCNLQQHIARMCRTATRFYGVPHNYGIEDVKIPEEYQKGVVKCRIVYDREIVSVTFDRYSMRSIKHVALAEGNGIEYEYKYEERGALNKLLELHGDCDEILIVRNGTVTDVSFGNVAFKDTYGNLFTPKTPLLKGTKRACLLSKGVIREREIKIEDIPSYLGFYILNAMIDIEDNLFIGTADIRTPCI